LLSSEQYCKSGKTFGVSKKKKDFDGTETYRLICEISKSGSDPTFNGLWSSLFFLNLQAQVFFFTKDLFCVWFRRGSE